MYKGDSKLYRLKIKNGNLISPCTISYNMSPRAQNWILSLKSGEVWKKSDIRWWFYLPKALEIGEKIQIGWSLKGVSLAIDLIFLEFKKGRLLFQEIQREQKGGHPSRFESDSLLGNAIIETIRSCERENTSKLLKSFQDFYEETGFLTEKQLACLVKIRRECNLDAIIFVPENHCLKKEMEDLDEQYQRTVDRDD